MIADGVAPANCCSKREEKIYNCMFPLLSCIGFLGVISTAMTVDGLARDTISKYMAYSMFIGGAFLIVTTVTIFCINSLKSCQRSSYTQIGNV